MKKLLSIMIAALMLLAIPMVLAEEDTNGTTCETGFGLEVGVTPSNSCPEIQGVDYEVETDVDSQICDAECNDDQDLGRCVAIVEDQRSYAFEGETITFTVEVKDTDGIEEDCVKTFVTLESDYDPIEAGCRLTSKEDKDNDNVYETGIFTCIYTVEPASAGALGEFWISVMAEDQCGVEGCEDYAPGTISLYLNPAVSLTINSQDTFGFMYDVGGDVLADVFAGETVYSPYFTLENSADPVSGLYLLLQIYGTDMYDASSSGALCPDSNVLDIGQVEYKADHSNVHQDWTEMPENYGGRDYIFDEGSCPFYGNFVGVGDDVTMRLRLNIPTPCKGTFDHGGEVVFVGRVI